MKYDILNIDGREYKTLFTKKYPGSKKWIPCKTEEITTAIPGTVVKLNVKNGDKVKKGDVLLWFEAMKMRNIISAPHSGEITCLEVKEGDSLPKGALILKIE
ncbi:MAG: acetyl-CoA carboxylase biotin carboxyl carrier protein subunit [Prevotellaceae bacterium]|jgi:biotin carboxyl carrier protein|nr:acetyl-CoA carboxylase biotin carboxyl carrier protein subunit [Prevotellaceae bacterium]